MVHLIAYATRYAAWNQSKVGPLQVLDDHYIISLVERVAELAVAAAAAAVHAEDAAEVRSLMSLVRLLGARLSSRRHTARLSPAPIAVNASR